MQVMFKLFAFIMMSLSGQFVLANESTGEQDPGRNPWIPLASPGWSDRPVQRDAIPAPPAGPYMSTGLMDKNQGFACCGNGNSNRMTSAPMMNTMPWPERRPPPPQMPESRQYNYMQRSTMYRPMPIQPGQYGVPEPQPMWQPMYLESSQ